MQGNPLGITNSQMAQVETYKKRIVQLYRNDYKDLPFDEKFYAGIITVSKFSIARQFKEEQVIEMWKNWMKWYHESKPYAISKNEEYIQKMHDVGKYRFCGRDKKGRPVMVIRMKFHVVGLVNLEQNLNYMLYMLQKGKRIAQQNNSNQIQFIYDRREVGQSDSVSQETMKKLSTILGDYYPELVGGFLVLGANLFYRAMWTVVSLFVAKRTQQKIHLLSDVSELTQYIDLNNLCAEHGGMLDIEKDSLPL